MDNVDNLKRGVVGGLAGGVAFGGMMGMMGMLPMIGGMLGVPSAVAGFAVHMMMSGVIGGGFGLLAGLVGEGRNQVVAAGLGWGALWWILGPLTFMPWLLGMGFAANWSLSGVSSSVPSLIGHLVFGAILGFTFHRLGLANYVATSRAASHGV